MKILETVKKTNIRTLCAPLKKHGRRLAENKSGNISLLFALTLVPVLLAIGASVDFVRAYNIQDRMQADLDAALLSAVNQVGKTDNEALRSKIVTLFNARTNLNGNYTLNTEDIAIDTSKAQIVARVSSTVDTTFMMLAGIKTVPILASSTAAGGETKTKSALSMYLVLDQSGSMGENTNTRYSTTCYKKRKGYYDCTKYFTKIESLQIAGKDLLDQIATADPEKKYARLGAVSYNREMQKASPLEWGTTSAAAYVAALRDGGGTDSSEAFRTAYESLNKSGENSAHASMNGQTPTKFIVFMTDGANNATSSDTVTKTWCDKARLANMEVFTIAFMAPSRGQALLKYCATDSGHYFEPEDTSELVSAFSKIGEKAAKLAVRLTN